MFFCGMIVWSVIFTTSTCLSLVPIIDATFSKLGEDISSNLAACEALTEQHEGVQLIICVAWIVGHGWGCINLSMPPSKILTMLNVNEWQITKFFNCWLNLRLCLVVHPNLRYNHDRRLSQTIIPMECKAGKFMIPPNSGLKNHAKLGHGGNKH